MERWIKFHRLKLPSAIIVVEISAIRIQLPSFLQYNRLCFLKVLETKLRSQWGHICLLARDGLDNFIFLLSDLSAQ